MSIRVWVSPPVLVNNGAFNEWQSTAQKYCAGFNNFFPSNADGSPASAWIITVGRAADWTAASADTALVDLFGGDLPSTIDTIAGLTALLRTRTVADVPLARRTAIINALDSIGVVHSDFTGTTPLWKVFQRVISTLAEKDSNFAAGFSF